MKIHTTQALPEAAHAQPIDPVAEAISTDPGAGSLQRLQEVLPEIKDLAQKVGGLKKLAEIAETLEQAEE